MLQVEHSAILSTIIKLPFVINTLDLPILSGHFTQAYCTSKSVTITCTHPEASSDSLQLPPFSNLAKWEILGWSELFSLLTISYDMRNNISKLGDFPECVHYGCASLNKRSYAHDYTNEFGVLRVL